MSNVVNKNSILESIGTEIKYNREDQTEKPLISQIFKETGLNWTVEQTPVHSIIPEVDEHISNAVINYRSDNHGFLGVVSDSHYHIVNNIAAFNFIDNLKNFTIERVGQAKGGQQVFVVGKSNNQIEITPNDYVQQYITFVHGHNGKQSIQLIISPIRMYCMNQLNLMLNNAPFKYGIRHVKNVDMKLERINRALEDNLDYMVKLGRTLQDLSSAKATETIDKFLDKLIPIDFDNEGNKTIARKIRIHSAIQDLYKNKDDNQNYVGSKFGMLNAVADYISHAKLKVYSSETYENAYISNIQNNVLLNKAYDILMAA